MWIHEHQAKAWFGRFGIPVPRGFVAHSVDEALSATLALGGESFVVKAQVHAGGRGKAGGVRVVHGRKALTEAVTALLAHRLVTAQTGPTGARIDCVLIEEPCVARQELYLACILDRRLGTLRVMVSSSGGVDIERQTPEILGVTFAPDVGLDQFECRKLAYQLTLPARAQARMAEVMGQLQRLAVSQDLMLAEINPLVLTADDDLVAVDAKIQIDDNALYRHPDLEALRDPGQEDAREARARAAGLSFVALDGDIGCMVNGAGLAMATMDLIRLHGGAPANFLDVGGSATSERVAQAFDLITSGEAVRAVLVNIFGGIVRCDLIAEGILGAVRQGNIALPVVVRLEGTRADEGRQILKRSGLKIIAVSTLEEAAHRAVAEARSGR